MSDRSISVLVRSDTYEGFERPGLDDARVRELEAAQDIPGLRQRLIELAREGVDGYDLMAFGYTGGASWDFIGFDVLGADGRSALVHRSDAASEDLISQHGLLWNQQDAQAFLEATGAAHLVPVFRFRRSAIRPGQALWYTIGNEFNPGDPFGRIVLTIDDAHHATLEHHWMQGNGAWEGDVAPGFLEDVRAALARGGFPHVPPHPVPGGATFRQVELVAADDPQYAMLEERFGMQSEGYKDAFVVLDALATALSGGRYRAGDAAAAPSVSNLRPLS